MPRKQQKVPLAKSVADLQWSMDKDRQRLESLIIEAICSTTGDDRDLEIDSAAIRLTNPLVDFELEPSGGPWLTATVDQPFGFVSFPEGISTRAFVVIDVAAAVIAVRFNGGRPNPDQVDQLCAINWFEAAPGSTTFVTVLPAAKAARSTKCRVPGAAR